MRGVDVARVVLLVGHELDPVVFIRNDVTEAVALGVFGECRRGEDAAGPFLGHLLVLCEDLLLFQLQLQVLTLQRRRTRKCEQRVLRVEYQATHHSDPPHSAPEVFHSVTFHQDYSHRESEKSHYYIRPHSQPNTDFDIKRLKACALHRHSYKGAGFAWAHVY